MKIKKPEGRLVRWLHAFISSFPQQIGMKWSLITIDGENHCLMPAGWVLCSSSHFQHRMQQLSWIQKTTFNFIPNPTVVLFSPLRSVGDSAQRQGRRLTGTPPWYLRPNESGAKDERDVFWSWTLYFRLVNGIHFPSKLLLLFRSCVFCRHMATRPFWSVYFS